MSNTRWCPDCNKHRPLADFYERHDGLPGKTYHYTYCRECCRERTLWTSRKRRARKAAKEGVEL